MPEDVLPDPNRTQRKPQPVPDAYGQAALVLVESLMHALVEKGSLTNDEAILLTDRAVEVKIAIAEELGEPENVMLHSLSLLTAIRRSLRSDR